MKTNFFKSRTFIGLLCLVLAFLITFVLTPLLSRFSEEKVTVLRVKSDIASGETFDASNTELVKIPSSAVPSGALTDAKSVAGKTAVVFLAKGDYIFLSKLADASDEDYEKDALSEGKVKISIGIRDNAQSLSSCLRRGDIVSCLVFEKDSGETAVPPELRYLYVAGVYDSGGEEIGTSDTGKISDITFLVTKGQAKMLLENSQNGTVFFALAYRGDAETARNYIRAEDAYLEGEELWEE